MVVPLIARAAASSVVSGGGGPVQIDVRDNIQQFTRYLTGSAQRQVPYATSVAMNKTAFDVRKEVVTKSFPTSFDLHNKRFPAVATRVAKATKTNLQASVYDRLGRDYLERQAEGGVKKPVASRSIAVPQFGTGALKRTQAGVPKRQRPGQLLADKRAFFVQFKSGQKALVQRHGKPRLPLNVLYFLDKEVEIPKRFTFYEDATAVVKKVFDGHFGRALLEALRRAR